MSFKEDLQTLRTGAKAQIHHAERWGACAVRVAELQRVLDPQFAVVRDVLAAEAIEAAASTTCAAQIQAEVVVCPLGTITCAYIERP